MIEDLLLMDASSQPDQPLGAGSDPNLYAAQAADLANEPTPSFPSLAQLPAVDSPFAASIKAAVAFASEAFAQEIKTKQLYYHGFEHVNAVAVRAQKIFDAVVPFCQGRDLKTGKPLSAAGWARRRSLLYLSAIAHDMVQVFLPQATAHSTRRREGGHSEQITFERLLEFLQEISPGAASPDAQFSESDIEILQEAIAATVCQFDPSDGAIFQPLLYQDEPISLTARALALADIGTLGMEGIAAYKREGGLLLLEENLDIIPFLQQGGWKEDKSYPTKPHSTESCHPVDRRTVDRSADDEAFDTSFCEGLKQRLLKRARFEVTFAKSRLARLDRELHGLPKGAIATLKTNIFTYLTPATIDQLAAMTPTAQDTSLLDLLDYFQLETYLPPDASFPC